jgi:hypothetical protein
MKFASAGCSPSFLAGSLGWSLEGVGDRSCAVGEDLEELKGLGIGGGLFLVNVGGAADGGTSGTGRGGIRHISEARCFT